LRADGNEFPLEAALTRSSVNGRPIFTLILRDISRRIRAMEAMLENENALMDFFTAAPLGLMWVRPDGTIERVNEAQLSLFDRKSGEVIAQPIAGFSSDHEIIDDIVSRVANHETVHNQRARLVRKDGSTRHVLIDANGLWKNGQLVHSRWFVRDISRRLDLEREILEIAERERERVSRELHDDLCQELLGIEFKTEQMARRWEATAPGAAQGMRRLSHALQRAIQHARDLARGLAPTATMVDRGLMESLQDLATHTQKVFHRKCRFRCETPVSIGDPAIGIHLYRIAQEAVSNAIRHGKATQIDIQLALHDRDLILGIHDNGGGMPAEFPKSKGMGLRIMQYRSGVINGSLAVQREARGGTAIVCTVKDALRAPPPN
jgi:PAS domain S-box-containing protein